LCTAPDDTGVLLVHTRKKARYVNQSDNRDIESITETYKTGGFLRCRNVQCSGQLLRLVSYHPHGTAFDAPQSYDNVGCIALLNLEQGPVINDGGDDF